MGRTARCWSTAAGTSTDDLIAYTATNSGTFTALVSAAIRGGTGTYVLHLAQLPEAFIVPAGDEGGPMTNGGNYAGTITLGDLDMWSFTANKGDNINVRLGTTVSLATCNCMGRTGRCWYDRWQHAKDDLIAYTATNSGTFTALVSAYDFGTGTGTYVLHLAQFPEPLLCLRAMKAGR